MIGCLTLTSEQDTGQSLANRLQTSLLGADVVAAQRVGNLQGTVRCLVCKFRATANIHCSPISGAVTR